MAEYIEVPFPAGAKRNTLRWFAELDRNNTVLRVVIVSTRVLVDAQGNFLDFPESEPVGQDYLNNFYGPNEFGETRIWKQTTSRYLAREDDPTQPVMPLQIEFRGLYAYVGGKYDPINDVFTYPSGNSTIDNLAAEF